MLDTYPTTIDIDVIVLDGILDSAQVLHQIRGRLRGDILVLSGDLIMENVIPDFIRFHKENNSSVSILLKQRAPIDEAAKKKAKQEEEVCIKSPISKSFYTNTKH